MWEMKRELTMFSREIQKIVIEHFGNIFKKHGKSIKHG